MSSKPALWHIPISHYSEKARWALDWKGIEHARHAPPPGAHMAIALALTRGAQKTFPVLRLEGETIGDSTAIIAALERYRPEPALYPEDPEERRRALELEEYFDEQLGPPIRLLAWHEFRRDPEQMREMSRSMLPGPLRRFGAARSFAGWFGGNYVQLRYRVADEQAAADARVAVLAALDRLDRELAAGDGRHLVGERFTVADLAAASLFYPLANPPEGPVALDRPPAGLAEFIDSVAERPGYSWIGDTFRRYRGGPPAS